MKEKNYKAFISYSHKDEKFARWLHKILENYRIPKKLYQEYPNLSKKLFPIFRDREELSTSSNLSSEILKALKNSEYLIVICSIDSSKSKWVNQEIIDFKRIHGEKKIHAIILNGEPHAKDIDKFDTELECFPESLKYEIINGKLSNIPTEPIAGDFRKGKDGKKHGKVKLISGILGVGFDELNQREKVRKRQKWFIWNILIGVVVLIVSFFIVYTSILKNSLINIKYEIDKLKIYIKNIDVENEDNSRITIVLNQKLEKLLRLKKEREGILDTLGLLEKKKEIVLAPVKQRKDEHSISQLSEEKNKLDNLQVDTKEEILQDKTKNQGLKIGEKFNIGSSNISNQKIEIENLNKIKVSQLSEYKNINYWETGLLMKLIENQELLSEITINDKTVKYIKNKDNFITSLQEYNITNDENNFNDMIHDIKKEVVSQITTTLKYSSISLNYMDDNNCSFYSHLAIKNWDDAKKYCSILDKELISKDSFEFGESRFNKLYDSNYCEEAKYWTNQEVKEVKAVKGEKGESKKNTPAEKVYIYTSLEENFLSLSKKGIYLVQCEY